MKLSDWAKENGLDYKTAYRLYRSGKFPLPTEQLATGTILVHKMPKKNRDAALYARVSSSDQREDMERQMQRLRDFASANGLHVVKEVAEIGSGLNGKRKKLIKLLGDPKIGLIVVEHRDRLARFGSEYISIVLEASGRKLCIINETECADDLVQDMIDVLTSFCARLYGRRSAKNKANKAMEAIRRSNDGDNQGIQDGIETQ